MTDKKEVLEKILPHFRLDYLTLWEHNNPEYPLQCLSPNRDAKLGIKAKIFLNNFPEKFRLKDDQIILVFEDIPITTKNGNQHLNETKLDLELILSINPVPDTNKVARNRKPKWSSPTI